MTETGLAGPWDALIVGGGPAGLSAALMLGRMGRRAVVLDGEAARNRTAHTVHGFLTADGLSPQEFRRAAVSQLNRYPGVTVLASAVTGAKVAGDGFAVTTDSAGRLTGRRLLLATGVRDVLPDIDGLAAAWGAGVYGCAYCHGWEARHGRLAVLGSEPEALIRLAAHLRNLSADVLAIVPGGLPAAQQAVARSFGLRIRRGDVVRVCALHDRDVLVTLADGGTERAAAVFVRAGLAPNTALAVSLGCSLDEHGRIRVNTFGHTSVAGVFAAGDVARSGIVAGQVISAAAAGAGAGVAVDQDLLMTRIETAQSQVRLVPGAASHPAP